MADRTYNMVDSRLYEEDWSVGARLVAGILLARCPNQYGIYDLPIWFLVNLLPELYDREQILGFVAELESENFIKSYNGGKLIWIVKKWKREQKNPSDNNVKGALRFLEGCNEGLANDFKGVYRGLAGACNPPTKKGNPLISTDSDTDSDSDTDTKKKEKDKRAVDKSTPAKPKPKPNPKLKVLSDGYFEIYQSHFEDKPAWGAQEAKRSKELLKRYNDNAVGILATIKYMFETEDKLWSSHIGTYVSLTSTRLMDRAIAHRKKPHKKENPF